MEQTPQEFFHDFLQELLAGAESNSAFSLEAFMEAFSKELTETGFIEGFEYCHYRAPRGMRVDGYWFDDEGGLDLFVADFESRRELQTLTRTEVASAFKRVVNFFDVCAKGGLSPDITTPEYGLAEQIRGRLGSLLRIRFHLLSERTLSERLQALPDDEISGVAASYHVWDISRIQRQRASRGHKEPLDIDFVEMFGKGLSCLPAHLDEGSLRSFLIVMPAPVISTLYDKYSARLLEQNVRTFLQARGQVNKGIRETILAEPRKFFAYNNGISATAQSVETRESQSGLQIIRMKDLQIVNGGQTTASLFHTQRKDRADLSGIFVQMKLTVINNGDAEEVVQKISQYANTQNRVNAADFFSNHPFHIRMEGISRRIYAPPQAGAQRETKWFYERTRGQYADVQSKLTPGEQKRFRAEYPKPQMFTKTDLAKFENVFDDHPRWVNLGSQKNFVRYAQRITKEWDRSPDDFNELYFKRAVARGILFRATEAMVSKQPWYNGGFRANVVAYTLSVLGEIAKRRDSGVNFARIWELQTASPDLVAALEIIAREVNEDLIHPPPGISNIGEWAKRDGCWDRLLGQVDRISGMLAEDFPAALESEQNSRDDARGARDTQEIDNGIEAQKRVLKIPAEAWRSLMSQMSARALLSAKEAGIMGVAAKIPAKIPSDAQCRVLIAILERARREGLLAGVASSG
jgi:hypothetical protein